MTVFSDMIDDLFLSDLAEDAVYKKAASGDLIPVRVLQKKDDQISSFGSSQAMTATVIFEVRSKDIEKPSEGDQVSIDGKIYTVQSDPEAISDGLVWVLNVAKVG